MNDRISERVKCPFYINVARGKNAVGIICEEIDPKLGFNVQNYTRLRTNQDLVDYVDIFCCDLWETCPYARAVKMIRYKEK